MKENPISNTLLNILFDNLFFFTDDPLSQIYRRELMIIVN